MKRSFWELTKTQIARLGYWDLNVFLQVCVWEVYYYLRSRARGIHYLFAVQPRDMDMPSPAKESAELYAPCPYLFIRQAFRRIGGAASGHTFMDLGAGAGRVLLCAMERDFGRIVGVEIDPQLAALAGKNVERFKKTAGPRDVSVLRANALDVEFPAGPLVLFFYEPFGRRIMQPLVDKLARHKDEVHVVYVGPHQKDLFIANGFRPIHDRANRHNRGFVILHRGPLP